MCEKPMCTWDDDLELAGRVVVEAGDRGLTVCTAESCTGGLVSGALTAVPGSSEVVLGGITSYALSVKHHLLGVAAETLDTVGAVSSECAAQMCLGAAHSLGADIAVSVTGIAGPGGEEPGKPVGTVWFGLCDRGTVSCKLCHFQGNREQIRLSAVRFALSLVLDAVSGHTC